MIKLIYIIQATECRLQQTSREAFARSCNVGHFYNTKFFCEFLIQSCHFFLSHIVKKQCTSNLSTPSIKHLFQGKKNYYVLSSTWSHTWSGVQFTFIHLLQYSITVATCVCCNMISETHTVQERIGIKYQTQKASTMLISYHQSTVNVLYLQCMIFGGKRFFQQVNTDLNYIYILYAWQLARYLIQQKQLFTKNTKQNKELNAICLLYMKLYKILEC